uniref:Putative ovule protein n=1 Tax=Solanum chacoense TaxID=4108 RepID=A0A0V0HYS6_SOLCH
MQTTLIYYVRLYLRGILLIFEALSGLKVNLGKSCIFSINADDCIGDLANILVCQVEKFPIVYLGFLLGVRRNDQNIWQGVLDRCAKTPWKKQYLSLWGRLTLINSILDSMPSYLMSLFAMPDAIERKMNSMRNKFLWEGNRSNKKIHLVRWQVVTRAKEGGGLGIRNLRLHNKNMLFKWLWRFSRYEVVVWIKIVEAIYGSRQGWNPPSNISYSRGGVWKGICKLWVEFQQFTKLEVGNGAKIRFWMDLWTSDVCLKQRFPIFFSCCNKKDGVVADFYSNTG